MPSPALPQDAYVDPQVIRARRAQFNSTQTILGDAFFERSTNTVIDGASHILELNPGRRKYSYGLYRFENLTTQDLPVQISVNCAIPLPEKFYVGISNYVKGRWEWYEFGVALETNVVAIPTSFASVNEGGACYVCVVAYDQQNTRILSVKLEMHIAAPAPQGLYASQGTSGSTVFLNWIDPTTSFDGLAYDRIAIERAQAAEGPWTQIGTASPGVTNYADIETFGTNQYPHNAPVYYRLKTIVAGNAGLPCTPVTGFRKLADVTGCSATDGAYLDKVKITWNSVVGADGYTVYYVNSQGGFPMGWTTLNHIIGGNILSFEHTSTFPERGECLPNIVYNYRVVATYQQDTSLNPSNEDTGYRNSLPSAMLQSSPLSGNVPLTVQLDASASTDADGGSITLYEWDWTGDGTYDFSGTDAIVTHTYSRHGSYAPVVRVTDNESTTATASSNATVMGYTRTWGLSDADVFNGTAIDLTGNIYAGGYNVDPVNGDENVLFCKYDSTGTIIWKKTWGLSTGDERAEAMYVDFAGNVFLAGWTDSLGEGGRDLLLLKYNSTGVLQWQKTWGGTENDTAYAVVASGAGGIAVAGATASFGAGGNDVIILDFTAMGALSTQKVWGGAGDEEARGLLTNGSAKYMTGSTTSYGAGQRDALLLTLDNLGNLDLELAWGGTGDDSARAMLLSGTDFVLTGSTASFGSGLNDGLVLKYDATGTLLLAKAWGGAQDDTWATAGLDAGGNLFIAGTSASLGAVTYATLTKLSSTGDWVNDRAYGGSAACHGNAVALTAMGALVLAGDAPHAGYDWSMPTTLVCGDVTGTETAASGTLSNVSGTLTDQSGNENTPGGTENTGAGDGDAFLARLGPGL